MLRRVALVRTDVSEERSASIIRVTRIGELGTTLAVTSNRRTLRKKHNGITYSLVFLRSVRRFLVRTSAVPSSPILVILMKEALSSSKTSVLTKATRRNIPEDVILQTEANWLIYKPHSLTLILVCVRLTLCIYVVSHHSRGVGGGIKAVSYCCKHNTILHNSNQLAYIWYRTDVEKLLLVPKYGLMSSKRN
jgi:hypothetical protein